MTTTHEVHVQPHPQRVRVRVGDIAIADSTEALLLTETGHDPVAYVPHAHVRNDLLVPTETSTHCPYKGDASYWSIHLPDGIIVDAVWGYPTPLPDAPDLSGYVAFYPDKVKITIG